jgi:hypothetical protein
MPTPAATATLAALITAAAAVAKKYLGRKPAPKPDLITRVEFHQSIDAVRDRIDAGHLALADKIDLRNRDVLSAIDRLATTTEHRLDHLDSAVARLDERTRTDVASINPLIH